MTTITIPAELAPFITPLRTAGLPPVAAPSAPVVAADHRVLLDLMHDGDHTLRTLTSPGALMADGNPFYPTKTVEVLHALRQRVVAERARHERRIELMDERGDVAELRRRYFLRVLTDRMLGCEFDAIVPSETTAKRLRPAETWHVEAVPPISTRDAKPWQAARAHKIFLRLNASIRELALTAQDGEIDDGEVQTVLSAVGPVLMQVLKACIVDAVETLLVSMTEPAAFIEDLDRCMGAGGAMGRVLLTAARFAEAVSTQDGRAAEVARWRQHGAGFVTLALQNVVEVVRELAELATRHGFIAPAALRHYDERDPLAHFHRVVRELDSSGPEPHPHLQAVVERFEAEYNQVLSALNTLRTG